MASAINEPSGPPTREVSRKKLPQGTRLVPMDLHCENERKILYNQRVICGWGEDNIPKWRESIARGERAFFWIVLPRSQETQETPIIHLQGEEVLPVGHIALDKVDHPAEGPPDESLVAPDLSALQISSLFILPTFQSLGLGAFAMDKIEALAQQEPYGSVNCRTTTLTTLSKRYLEGPEDGPDGRGRWKRVGEVPRRDNVEWYMMKGYAPYKEAIRYWSDLPNGERLSWMACYMAKNFDVEKRWP